MRIVLGLLVLLFAGLGTGVYGLGKGWFGNHEGPGIITDSARPETSVAQVSQVQEQAAEKINAASDKQILFGDLHVHTTISLDAFLLSLPALSGEGTHPQADACDFARFCSALDFWSINDHAEAITPTKWRETAQSIRQCNDVAANPDNPDTVAFLGWEWTQVGDVPENHYGHKNVVLKGIEEDEIPDRPILAGGRARDTLAATPFAQRLGLIAATEANDRSLDFARYMEELSQSPECPGDDNVKDRQGSNCRESAETPDELFRKLDKWGHEAIVIPHGTTWGFYTPGGSSWDKQLVGDMHDDKRQTLLEVFSGHGNSEEYRSFREVAYNNRGEKVCPEPTEGFLPSCWRAGELIRQRCRDTGKSSTTCDVLAQEARQNYINAGVMGHHAVRGEAPEEWLDSGQCRDCFLPSFNYRPGGSAQYILAITNFDDPNRPRNFRMGFMASSDNHTARPGTGYKEINRREMTEAAGGAIDAPSFLQPPEEYPDAYSVPVNRAEYAGFQVTEAERQASFFMTGGLIAVHSEGRNRQAIWDAMQRKETYGTSGPRTLLWFDMVMPDGTKSPMGSEVTLSDNPRFEVKAVGSLKQKPGCPEYATKALSEERLYSLCRNECYNPTSERKKITRIEVVRVRPQISADENVATLVQDPWLVHECDGNEAGCIFSFEDSEFSESGRNAVYYARAIEEKSLAINADNLRCEYDDKGNCVKVNICHGSVTNTEYEDDCLSETEERAWSSPIYVDQAG